MIFWLCIGRTKFTRLFILNQEQPQCIKMSKPCIVKRFHIECKAFTQKIKSIHSTTHSNNQCNCRDKETCPLLGNYRQKNVVYWATLKTNSSVKQYIVATEGTIKQIIYNHKLSFTHRNYSSNTSLFAYIWHLKNMSISPTITWELLKLAPAYHKTSR